MGQNHLAPGSQVLSDGLVCFRSLISAGCSHEASVTGGKHPNDLPQYRCFNTLLGKLKTSFTATFHTFNWQLRQAQPRRLVLQIQQELLRDGDDRTDHECDLVMHILHRNDLRVAEAYG